MRKLLPCFLTKKRRGKAIFAGASLAALLLIAPSAQASGLIIETRQLTVSDAAGKLSDERLKALAAQAQDALDRIQAFWAVDDRTEQSGKIQVVFDDPRKGVYYASVFHRGRGLNRRTRFVRVFGCEGPPLEMVHKLTSAIFPHPDKLIRNMMGVPTEERLGNLLAFPGCGFSSDTWVSAFLKMKVLIPLDQLGEDHESWGMRIGRDGYPYVFDRDRQTRAYAEAGSFGDFLIRTYGVGKIRKFYELSERGRRPWQDVFGATLHELEANWLKSLQGGGRINEQEIVKLVDLFTENSGTACLTAQKLITEKP